MGVEMSMPSLDWYDGQHEDELDDDVEELLFASPGATGCSNRALGIMSLSRTLSCPPRVGGGFICIWRSTSFHADQPFSGFVIVFFRLHKSCAQVFATTPSGIASKKAFSKCQPS